jgi:hypothetical protein
VNIEEIESSIDFSTPPEFSGAARFLDS